MPELPDLTVVADALHAAVSGRRIRPPRRPGRSPCAARRPSSPPLVDQQVKAIRRRGKFLLIELERDAIACNPMLTGRFQLAAPGDKLPAKTAVILGFGPRDGGPRRRGLDGRSLAAGRRCPAEVRYRDPTQMGKIYLRRRRRPVAGPRPPTRDPTPTTRR